MVADCLMGDGGIMVTARAYNEHGKCKLNEHGHKVCDCGFSSCRLTQFSFHSNRKINFPSHLQSTHMWDG